jgi:hypothetical protein
MPKFKSGQQVKAVVVINSTPILVEKLTVYGIKQSNTGQTVYELGHDGYQIKSYTLPEYLVFEPDDALVDVLYKKLGPDELLQQLQEYLKSRYDF